MSTHSNIDLSKLNAPQIIATPTSESLYNAMLDELKKCLPKFDATVESDPAIKLLQAVAYCAERMRHDVNQAGHQVMLAFATGDNLDHLGALVGVKRFLLTPEDTTTIPPTPAKFEDDASFRLRIQKALESFTTAGSKQSYEFHAKSAHADVLDVSVESYCPGVVTVTILVRFQ